MTIKHLLFYFEREPSRVTSYQRNKQSTKSQHIRDTKLNPKPAMPRNHHHHRPHPQNPLSLSNRHPAPRNPPSGQSHRRRSRTHSSTSEDSLRVGLESAEGMTGNKKVPKSNAGIGSKVPGHRAQSANHNQVSGIFKSEFWNSRC